uniref:Aberrant pre-S/S protein n=1 Tax=Hepatitis B virus TaxID=10407 RepID=Q8V4P2_HBV|nr:aberrant pre-S/S protein [Hepatitis B virus]
MGGWSSKAWGQIFLSPIPWDSSPIISWTLHSKPTQKIQIGTSIRTRTTGRTPTRWEWEHSGQGSSLPMGDCWGGALRLRAYSQLCQQLLLLPPPIGSQEGSLLPYLHL